MGIWDKDKEVSHGSIKGPGKDVFVRIWRESSSMQGYESQGTQSSSRESNDFCDHAAI